MKKVAKRTISNREPRTVMTMSYSGKGSEINHRYSTVKDLYFYSFKVIQLTNLFRRKSL